ncbi:hypothetical protein J2X31_001865 [Flavobacterium arsenatis]|uniref:DUF1493 family protein n=1 Tax=Flavobacterium arsenatis TaxID=1484332 RepID=A0ABU1TPI4_9FLAO|nr:hypothetical protein [Flavobacterium arsenatis]MDR6967851.1 hypothetical protein [Flavobacterium arsenatis]
MTKEELQKIIDQFHEEVLREEAIFGIFQYGGASDESHVKANKEGIELFALKLLKASRDLDDNSTLSIPFDDENWLDENSDTFIHYIQFTTEKKKAKTEDSYKETFVDKLIPFGCLSIVVAILLTTIIGFLTIFKWIF